MKSEREIWQALKNGDRSALGLIFKAHYQALHHYGMKICPDDTLIKDLLQDFFLYLYDHRENLSELDHIRPYLFTSFRRRLFRQLKTDSRKEDSLKKLFDEGYYIHFSAEELLIEQEESANRKSILIQMLTNLPPRQQEAIYLRYYCDLSIKEIAVVMSISYQATVNTMYKAFTTLRSDERLMKIISIVAFCLAIFLR